MFKGKVVTAEGKAVPNAEVVLSEFTEGSFAPWRPRKGNARISQLETRSLADGSFSFPSLVLDTHEPLRGGMGCIISKVIEAKAKVNGVVQHGRLSSRTDAPAVVRLELPAAVSTERK